MKRLAIGNAPYATKGKYAGQRVDVEHIVPVNLAPSLDNILSNLTWLPRSLNASKSDTVTSEVLEMATKFEGLGILPRDEFMKVKSDFE